MLDELIMYNKQKKITVKLVKFEVIKIPIINQKVFSYEFEEVQTRAIFKCILEKKRGTLKGVVEGDVLEVLCSSVRRMGNKKYEIERLRVVNNEVY